MTPTPEAILVNNLRDLYEHALDVAERYRIQLYAHGVIVGVTPAVSAAKREAYERAKEEAATLARNWGNAPPNPNGRRAALADAIRALHNPYPKPTTEERKP